jgi:hypothetical protein
MEKSIAAGGNHTLALKTMNPLGMGSQQKSYQLMEH